MPPEAVLLTATGLVRTFGTHRALSGVDLTLHAGEAVAVAGPNGAGKTTLLRVLAGLMRPSAGTVGVGPGGRSPREPEARRLVGLLSHQSFLYEDLTPHENLIFTARLHGLPDPAGRAAEALARMELAERGMSPVRELSRGMVQRVALARALLHDPRVLLLDEPFTGMDASAAARLRLLLERLLAEGRGVVVVTHHLGEVWEVVTRVGLLVRGRWARIAPRPPSLPGFLAEIGSLTDA